MIMTNTYWSIEKDEKNHSMEITPKSALGKGTCTNSRKAMQSGGFAGIYKLST